METRGGREHTDDASVRARRWWRRPLVWLLAAGLGLIGVAAGAGWRWLSHVPRPRVSHIDEINAGIAGIVRPEPTAHRGLG